MVLGVNIVNWDVLGNLFVYVVDYVMGDFGVVGDIKVVVVDVQFSVGVGGVGSMESDVDEVFIEYMVENVVLEVIVFSEDFVYNVLVGNFVFVVGDYGGNMVLNDLGESVVIVDVVNLLGKLGVLEECVVLQFFIVCLGLVDNVVSVGEGELVMLGCERVSLSWIY